MDKEKTRDEMVERNCSQRRLERVNSPATRWEVRIAQAVAAKSPERVAKLILLNTWATDDPRMLSIQTRSLRSPKTRTIAAGHAATRPLLIHPSRFQDPDLMRNLVQMVSHFSIDALIQQLEAMLSDYSSLHHHPSITAPTLVIHSRQDALFPDEHHALLSGIKTPSSPSSKSAATPPSSNNPKW